MFNWLEIGQGWNVAILNNTLEMNFIKEGQISFSDNRSYWIGGKTNTKPGQYFQYSAYNSGMFSINEFNSSDDTGILFSSFANSLLDITC